MTSPDKPIPEKTWTAADINQLQNVDQTQYAIDDNTEVYDQAELVRQTFFTVIYSTVQQIPIIGGMIGDIIEIITGVEDGDLNDLGTWVNNLGHLVNSFIAAALHALADLLDMVPIVGDNLAAIIDGIADGINGTNATANTAKSTALSAQGAAAAAQTTADTAVTHAGSALTQSQAAINAAANASNVADMAYENANDWQLEFVHSSAEVVRATGEVLVGPMLNVRGGQVAILTDVHAAFLEQHGGLTFEVRIWNPDNTAYSVAHTVVVEPNVTRKDIPGLTVNVDDLERFWAYVVDIVGTAPPTVLSICVAGVFVEDSEFE